MSWIADLQATLPAGGLTLLFAKALLILLLGALLADDVGLSSAAIRHRVRFATLLCLVALPLLSWVAPRWHLPFLSTGGGSPGTAVIAALLFIYCCGVLLRGARLLRDLAAVVGVTRRSAPPPPDWRAQFSALQPPARVRLRASDAIDSPLTWGHLQPVILVPRRGSLDAAEQRMALQHELGHIHRGDWLAHLLGRIAGVLYWPIPGLRPTIDQLALEAEQACDNQVLAAQHPAPDYASLLLAQARGHRLRAAVPLSRQSQLALRIRNICSPGADHSVRDTGWPWLLPLCLALALPLSGLQLTQRPHYPLFTHTTTPETLRWTVPAVSAERDPLAVLTRPQPLPAPADQPALPVNSDGPATTPARAATAHAVGIDILASPARSARFPSLDSPWQSQQPAYPRRARQRQIEGAVTVRYDVDRTGRIDNARILRAQPPGVFETSVMSALARARFSPVSLQGSPTALRDLETTFRFRLTDSAAPPRPP